MKQIITNGVKNVDFENRKTRQSEKTNLNGSTITFELLESLRDGNRKAFEKIYLHYHSPIIHFMNALVNSYELAEDLYQDIFMNIWMRRKTIDPNKNFKYLIFVSARNIALDHLKKYKEIRWNEEEIITVQDRECADRWLLLNETLEQVNEVINKMPLQRKKVFTLSRIENLSNNDISQQLHITKNAVEKHICFALKDIRNALHKETNSTNK